MQVGMNIYS